MIASGMVKLKSSPYLRMRTALSKLDISAVKPKSEGAVDNVHQHDGENN